VEANSASSQRISKASAAFIQVAQAAELVSGPADTSLPVVMAGDFNSNANSQPSLPDNTPTYGNPLACGFSDIWPRLGTKLEIPAVRQVICLIFPRSSRAAGPSDGQRRRNGRLRTHYRRPQRGSRRRFSGLVVAIRSWRLGFGIEDSLNAIDCDEIVQ
jgi:hypothetical protein